jgi:lipoteichoic acid synthase
MNSLLNLIQKQRGIYLSLLMFFFLFLKGVIFHFITNTVLSSGVITTTLGLILILFAFSYLFNGRGRLIYAYIIDLFLSIALLANTLYLHYFSSPITVSTFYQTNNLSGLGESIFHLFQFSYLIYLVDLVVLPFFFFRMKIGSGKRHWKKAALLVVIGLLLVVLKPVKLIFINKMENPFQTYDSKDFAVQYGIFGHHILDTYFHWVDKNFQLSDSEKDEIDQMFKEQKVTDNSEKGNFKGYGEGKNLILIQVESLQNFVLNEKVNGEEITPEINNLLRNSLYFPNFYAQTIQGNSSDAEFLTQTSLFPLMNGAVFFRYPHNKYVAMPSVFKQNGYETLAVHGDEKTFWNRNVMYPVLGIDEYIDIDQLEQDEMIGMGLGDKSMFEQTADILNKKNEPFYSLIVTLTSHVPYEMPKEEKVLDLSDDLGNSLLGNYFQSVHYTDAAIGQFIDELEQAGALKDSVVVLYGDHNGIFYRDKSLVENQWLNKTISKDEWYQKYATVPFIIYDPSLEGKQFSTMGGQIDVFPTLSHFMGVSNPNSRYLMGKNLLITENNTVIVPSGGYVEQPLSINKEGISYQLTEDQQKVLKYSNLIIKGNYFKDVSLE